MPKDSKTTIRVKKSVRDKAKAKAAIEGKSLEAYIEEVLVKASTNGKPN